MKTIKEIAAECGVSEQAVRAWCRRNHVAKDAKGSFAISEIIKTAIYRHYRVVEGNEVSQSAKASCETCETSETLLIAMLQKELDLKNEQLSVKDKHRQEVPVRPRHGGCHQHSCPIWYFRIVISCGYHLLGLRLHLLGFLVSDIGQHLS